MLDAVWLIPALPLAGFLVLLVAGRKLGEPAAGWLATLAMAGSFVAAVVVFAGLVEREAEERTFVQTLFSWVPVSGLSVDVGFLVDPLSVTFALFITGVATLIHLYSIGYMHGDERFSRFFLLLNLFAFFMLVLVLGDNLLLTFLGWEGVGLCSYQLIAFWFRETPNAVAGKKAFVTNRVGDFGFMIAMFLAFAAVGSLDYLTVLGSASGLATSTATAIALLLFVGAIGKSAQFPLFVWLPDAMAGPTPVSALIHAATMVTSGVYLLTRINPLIHASEPWAADLIAWVGVGTALLAATIAVAQVDVKKVLAYSTISQLGFTVLAVGTGAYVAAIFHVVTHAFFKALLFLGSGSVIHGMHDEQDMRAMGGLRKYLPVTAATFIVGWLAIAGVPPFAGFWSKDEILAHAWDTSPALWVVGVIAALLTAFYMSRQVFLVFFGPERWRELPGPEGAEADEADRPEPVQPVIGASVEDPVLGPGPDHQPHESPWTMTVPLVVLAAGAAVVGFVNLPFTDDLKVLKHWLEPVVEEGEVSLTLSGGVLWLLAVLSVLVALVGIALAARVYLRGRADEAAKVERKALAHGWYIDESMARFTRGPGRASFDLTARFDSGVIDGAVNGVASLVAATATRLRHLQTGYVRNYALLVAAGAVALVAWLMTRINL